MSGTAAEAFLREHGAALAHNLAADCWRAAQEICTALGAQGQLPAGVTPEGVLRVVLSMRATLELMAVDHRFGTPAHDALLEAMSAHYERALLASGRFTSWIAAAHETMRRSENPREWLRIHAMNALDTRDPEAETFHLALGYGLRVGPSIAEVVATNIGPADGDAPSPDVP